VLSIGAADMLLDLMRSCTAEPTETMACSCCRACCDQGLRAISAAAPDLDAQGVAIADGEHRDRLGLGNGCRGQQGRNRQREQRDAPCHASTLEEQLFDAAAAWKWC